MSDDNLFWYIKQKRGIHIIEPNSNLTKAYLKKTFFDGVAAFQKIAEHIHSNEKIDPHEYEEELEQRGCVKNTVCMRASDLLLQSIWGVSV